MAEPRSRRSTALTPAGMAGDAGPNKPARHTYGPRALSALVPAIVRPGFARQPPLAAQVIADWGLIVGPALAARTAPRRLAAGTLTVACAGPHAMELQHASDLLIARINTHLGQPVVQRLRLVQDVIAPPPADPAPPPIRPADRAAVERKLAGIPPGPLRDALASLGLAIRRR